MRGGTLLVVPKIDPQLRDKNRLTRIATAAQSHVMAHHTPAALARYVVEVARSL